MRALYPHLLTASLCLVSPLAGPVQAEVTPADVFADHMVLQRGKPAPVWGWADRGEKVTVKFALKEVMDKAGRAKK
jgi:sialate O-acetylesterase